MSDEETALLKAWAAAHDLKDDMRFGALGARVDARVKWLKHLTITNVLGILVFVGSGVGFWLIDHNKVIASEEVGKSVVAAIERLRTDMSNERIARVLADDNAREAAAANNRADRMKSLENNASDRAKARAESEASRAKARADSATSRAQSEADRAKAKNESKPAREKAPVSRPWPAPQGPGPWPWP